MSSFNRLTTHPITGKKEQAEWLDDYFGTHKYGVRFLSDGKVYPYPSEDSEKKMKRIKLLEKIFQIIWHMKMFENDSVKASKKIVRFIHNNYRRRKYAKPRGLK